MRKKKRSFAIYSNFKDLNGVNVFIVRSSLASKRAVCIFLDTKILHCIPGAMPGAHVTVPMAKRVIKALQLFVDGKG